MERIKIKWITEQIEEGWPKVLGLFYEKILRNWLIYEKTWTLIVKEPIIYYEKQKRINKKPSFQYIDWVIESYNKEKENKKYFKADGYFKDSNNRNIIVEAKSWIPGQTWNGKLTSSFSPNRFFLADNLTFDGKEIKIDHYVLVFWSGERDGGGIGENYHQQGSIIQKNILSEYNSIWPDRTFEIIYLVDMYNILIQEKPAWYIDIIENEETIMKSLFRWLYSDYT